MIKIKTICFFTILILLFSCDNEPYEGDIYIGPSSCELAILDAIEAQENLNQSTENTYAILCQEYRNALNRQIFFCGDENGELQSVINELGNCQNTNPDLCAEAVEATAIAEMNFNNALENNFEELCNEYIQALEYQINVCGDDGTLQGQLNSIGNCEPEQVDVVGTWKLISWSTDESIDLNNDGIETSDYLDEIDCYNDETILFNADGTGTMFFRSVAEFTFTPNENGEDFFIVCNEVNEDKLFMWSETINTVDLLFQDGTGLSLFKNGNLYVAVDDAFYATSTIDDAIITERIIFGYSKL